LETQFNVLLVGGFDGLPKELAKKLNPFGIRIKEHWVNKKDIKTSHVPSSCNGVIILKDICSHHLYEQAKIAAEKSGVKWCTTVRKWALMELDLRATGFLAANTALTPDTVAVHGSDPVGKFLKRAAVQENKALVSKTLTSTVKEAVMATQEKTVVTAAAKKDKTREELITELKKTLNELFVNHHVASVQASADGIKIRVMEELNIPM
jgi:hypothetical protein